jgi:hypothetical protein
VDVEATQRALALVVTVFERLSTGSSDFARALFSEEVTSGSTDDEMWKNTVTLTIGALNLSAILAGRLANATGESVSKVLNDVGLKLAYQPTRDPLRRPPQLELQLRHRSKPSARHQLEHQWPARSS